MLRKVTMACVCALAACTTTERLYDGPQRPASEIAVVTVDQDSDLGYHFAGGHSANIERVDGRRISAERVELLPGPHELCAAYEMSFGFSSMMRFAGPVGTLQFLAEAGGEYQVQQRYSDERGATLVLVDLIAEEQIADSYVPEHARNPVQLDLSGEGWVLASAGAASCTQRVANWVREGATLQDHDEIVQAVETVFDIGKLPDLDAALKDREDVIDSSTSIGDEWEVLHHDAVSASFEYSGDLLGSPKSKHGVGFLKVDGARLLYFLYEVTDKPLPAADRDAWLARFKRQ